eukprot:CAMPEP_0118696214 /NCGR_PEP_ID=MMETSP0800-20121206/13703_1 /TAXON_ID=210618 ORGANISM="Striatella unipunctata, Strain CCMP2910" /NCGR_SAMPLE_ID=MMETSP0800 /ASSEMBLY_ACC=CAM_ASM_000638 /LENGTH=143 /DNA_ID=CAMNT_0006595263 /DNA_START=300 /DNA_END=731 /DNA_ORIENTATION=-
MVMDLLAFAHEDTNGNDWKFCPHHNKNDNDDDSDDDDDEPKRPSLPWGMGERSCPAGSLSMDALGAALEEVMDKYHWRTTTTNTSSSTTTTNQWFDNVVYSPTLTYPTPLVLEFTKKESCRDNKNDDHIGCSNHAECLNHATQ